MIGLVTDSSVTLVDFEGFEILNLVLRGYDEDFFKIFIFYCCCFYLFFFFLRGGDLFFVLGSFLKPMCRMELF